MPTKQTKKTSRRRKRAQHLESRKMTGPQLQRMLKIHDQLQKRKFPTVRGMAKILEKSPRTIARDFRHMRIELGLPMKYSPAKRGWHYSSPVGSFPTQLIAEQDLHLIAILDQMLASLDGSEMKKKLQRILEEFTNGLTADYRKIRGNWRNIVSIRFPNRVKFNRRLLDFLTRAAANRMEVMLEYRKPNQPDWEERTFDPLHLFMLVDWYIFARDHKTGKIKTFSVHRMRNLRCTGKKFSRPRNFDPDAEFAKSFGLYTGEGDYEIVLRIKPHIVDYIHEREWNGLRQIIPLPNGGVELHLNLSSLVEIQRWIQSWPGGIRVMQPPHLRKMVADAAMATYCENREEESEAATQ